MSPANPRDPAVCFGLFGALALYAIISTATLVAKSARVASAAPDRHRPYLQRFAGIREALPAAGRTDVTYHSDAATRSRLGPTGDDIDHLLARYGLAPAVPFGDGRPRRWTVVNFVDANAVREYAERHRLVVVVEPAPGSALLEARGN